MDQHPDGRMKKGDFKEMMEKVKYFVEPLFLATLYKYLYIKALPRKDAKKMENHLFRLYDTNNDGSIEFTEFMVII